MEIDEYFIPLIYSVGVFVIGFVITLSCFLMSKVKTWTKKTILPVQQHFINVSHRRAPLKYMVIMRFGCPSYSYDFDTCHINYEILNDDKSIAAEGKHRGDLMNRDDITEAWILIGRPTPLQQENFNEMRIWLTSTRGRIVDYRLFLFSMEVSELKMQVKNGKEIEDLENKKVYPIKRWIKREAVTIKLRPEGDSRDDNKFQVPKITLPDLSQTEYALMLMTTACLVSMVTCLSIFFNRRNWVGYLFAILYGIFTGIIFTSTFISVYRLKVRRREVESRVIRGTEDSTMQTMETVLPGLLLVLSLVFTSVPYFLEMKREDTFMWIIISSISILIVLFFCFLVKYFETWRKVSMSKNKKLVKTRTNVSEGGSTMMDVFDSVIESMKSVAGGSSNASMSEVTVRSDAIP